jgi:NAD-dependent oxidoreductase involved in siderophore biosynthesis
MNTPPTLFGGADMAKRKTAKPRAKRAPRVRRKAEQHPAVRVVYTYGPKGVRPILRQTIDTAPPAETPPDMASNHGSLWYSLHDKSGKILFRHAIRNPIRNDVEVFPEPGSNHIHRIAAERPHGAFTIVAPNLPYAHSIALHNQHPAQAKTFAAVTPPVRHTLSKIPRLREK